MKPIPAALLCALFLSACGSSAAPTKFDWQQISPRTLHLDVAPLNLDITIAEERGFHFGIYQRAVFHRGIVIAQYAERGKLPRPIWIQWVDEKAIAAVTTEAWGEDPDMAGVSLRHEARIFVRGERHGHLFSLHGSSETMPVDGCWFLSGAVVAFPTPRDFERMNVEYDTVLALLACGHTRDELEAFFREARVFSHFRKAGV